MCRIGLSDRRHLSSLKGVDFIVCLNIIYSIGCDSFNCNITEVSHLNFEAALSKAILSSVQAFSAPAFMSSHTSSLEDFNLCSLTSFRLPCAAIHRASYRIQISPQPCPFSALATHKTICAFHSSNCASSFSWYALRFSIIAARLDGAMSPIIPITIR